MKIYFMDLTDFDHELGEAGGYHYGFEKVDDLWQRHPCVRECGICTVSLHSAKERQKGDRVVYAKEEDDKVTFSPRKEEGMTQVCVRLVEVVRNFSYGSEE